MSLKDTLKNVAIFSFVAGFLFQPATAMSPDVHMFCQGQTDKLKMLAQYTPEQLRKLRRHFANATSFEALSILTDYPIDSMIAGAMGHQDITKFEAEQAVRNLIKEIEIPVINDAIEVSGVSNDKVWDQAYKNCVSSNVEDFQKYLSSQ